MDAFPLGDGASVERIVRSLFIQRKGEAMAKNSEQWVKWGVNEFTVYVRAEDGGRIKENVEAVVQVSARRLAQLVQKASGTKGRRSTSGPMRVVLK